MGTVKFSLFCLEQYHILDRLLAFPFSSFMTPSNIRILSLMQVKSRLPLFWYVDLTFGKGHGTSSQGIYYYGVSYHQESPGEVNSIIASPTGG